MSRNPIQDEFTHLKVSHQRKTQLRWKRDGRCIICGKLRSVNSNSRCAHHVELHNIAQRAALGHKAWRKGCVGRPPNSVVRKRKT